MLMIRTIPIGGKNNMVKLRQHREAAGLTQETLARKIGVTTRALVWWESGKRLPRIDTCQAIAAALSKALGRPVSIEEIWPPTETTTRAAGE